jgi:hypothetical protein
MSQPSLCDEIRSRALRQKRVALGLLRSANRDLCLPPDDETMPEHLPTANPIDTALGELEYAIGNIDRAIDRLALLHPSAITGGNSQTP